MRIGNRIFPYPVLNSNSTLSNYLDYKFDINFEMFQDDSKFVLKDLYFDTNSKLLNELVDNGKVNVVCIIECSDTVYREKFNISKTPKDYPFYKSDFSEKTSITFFAYAKENLKLNSNEFDVDYQGITFNIDKYDILAANDDKFITVKHQSKESNLVESIFSIVNNLTEDNGVYSIEYNSNKITIYLGKEDYANYKAISNISEYKEIFFNVLLIPTLVEALNKCKNLLLNDQTIDDISDEYKWFRSIQNGYKKLNNEELTKETFINKETIEFVQELLGKPLSGAFKSLINIGSTINMEDE